MAWKKKRETADETAEAPEEEERVPKTPTFEIREARDGRPFSIISGRLGHQGRGRSVGILMMFPGKFEGQFASMTLAGYKTPFIKVTEENIDFDDDGALILDFEWMQIRVKGENVEELQEWLNYIPEIPKEKGRPFAAPGKKKSWKK